VNIVFLLFKVMLLAFGMVLIAGGGLLGVCGLIVNQGQLIAVAVLPVVVGLIISVPVIQDFNRRARAGKKPVAPPPPADEGEQ